MKKLIIALGVVALAAGVQAAAFNWTTSGTNASKTFYGPDGASLLTSGTVVYLLDASVSGNSQSDLVAGFRSGKAIGDFATITSTTVDANSRLTAKGFEYGAAGNNYDLYMAIVVDDNVFVSASKTVLAQQADTVSVQFSSIKSVTQTLNADAAYSGAGWYSTASAPVPEPTSGLLMLLGMAGLALRRRRA